MNKGVFNVFGSPLSSIHDFSHHPDAYVLSFFAVFAIFCKKFLRLIRTVTQPVFEQKDAKIAKGDDPK